MMFLHALLQEMFSLGSKKLTVREYRRQLTTSIVIGSGMVNGDVFRLNLFFQGKRPMTIHYSLRLSCF